jgi:hypothetical protein
MIVYSCTRALGRSDVGIFGVYCSVWLVHIAIIAHDYFASREIKTTRWGWHWEASHCNQDSRKQTNSMHLWYNNIATSDLFDGCNGNIGHGWKHVRHTKGYFSSSKGGGGRIKRFMKKKGPILRSHVTDSFEFYLSAVTSSIEVGFITSFYNV